MTPVYGSKQLEATKEGRDSWMARFMNLEPAGGVRAAVRQAWSLSPMTLVGASSRISQNGHMVPEPVYGRKPVVADAGARETWMDRFAKLEPEGGFRAVVRRVGFLRALAIDSRNAELATLFTRAATDVATPGEHKGLAVLVQQRRSA